MRVTAVVPNWNGSELLRTLLPTLKAQSRRFDRVIVVDNGSTDDSAGVAERAGARVVRFETNRGFAAAVNSGAAQAQAQADVLAILNNDVELDPQWLECGLASFEDASVAFVVGKTVNPVDPTLLDGTFDAICRGACALRCGSGARDAPYWSTSRRVQIPPMTALLIRTTVFVELGGLDEAFESYMEDVEFGLRCASYGYTGIYEPHMIATHRGSATLGVWNARTVRFISRNQVFLVARHYGNASLRRFGWPIAVAQVLWGFIAIRRGEGAAWAAGKIEGLRRFRSLRRTGSVRLPEILVESERLIAEVNRISGGNWYWRLYFALTPRVPGA